MYECMSVCVAVYYRRFLGVAKLLKGLDIFEQMICLNK